MVMRLKTVEVDGKQYAEISDGKPVYFDDEKDNAETTYDPVEMHGSIRRLNAEAKTHREAKEEAEKQLKAFGDLDPEKARDALEKVQKLDQKQLIDAGEVDKVKESITSEFQKKLDAAEEARQAAEKTLHQEKIGGAFARSKFINDNLAIPADMVQATFGQHFGLDENGRMVAKDKDGNPIYSSQNPGEYADFDEALGKLVDNYQHRDAILKGTGNSGSGAGPGSGGGGPRRVSRAELDRMSPQDQHKTALAVRSGEVELTE